MGLSFPNYKMGELCYPVALSVMRSFCSPHFLMSHLGLSLTADP